MIESRLWKLINPELNRVGKFQKISDRFTPGIPDVLGCYESVGIAIELKELSGVSIVRTKFRPGQIPWLTDWKLEGGTSLIISSHNKTVMVHQPEFALLLESGSSLKSVLETSSYTFVKSRNNSWRDFVNGLTKILK